MENLSLLVSFSFVILFGYFLTRMVWSIGNNLVQGRELRRRVRERLMTMPLARALERAGTDPDLYLHERQLQEIDRQMRNCGGCSATPECQRALDAAAPIETFEFCPNHEALFKVADKDAL